MNHFQQSLLIAASPDATYAALSTIDGLRGWWTQDCAGDTGFGGTIQFCFGSVSKEMQVERADPGREVHWVCTHACIDVPSLSRKDEWVGTKIVFRLSDIGPGKTKLHFEHIGLVPSFECYGMCEKGWRHFLSSLQQYLETGTGKPHLTQAQCQGRSLPA